MYLKRGKTMNSNLFKFKFLDINKLDTELFMKAREFVLNNSDEAKKEFSDLFPRLVKQIFIILEDFWDYSFPFPALIDDNVNLTLNASEYEAEISFIVTLLFGALDVCSNMLISQELTKNIPEDLMAPQRKLGLKISETVEKAHKEYLSLIEAGAIKFLIKSIEERGVKSEPK